MRTFRDPSRPLRPGVLPLALVFASLALLSATACQTTTGGAAGLSPSRNWSLVEGAANADIDQLAEDFYATAGSKSLPYPAFRLRLAALEKAAAINGKLNEVLAYDARLRADEDASFGYFLKAIADRNYDAPLLAIWELFAEPRTAQQWADAKALLEVVAANHPSPLVQQQARSALQSIWLRQGDVDAAKRGLEEHHLLTKWSLVGAFDNDQGKGFLTPYPPEAGVVLDATAPGRRSDVQWRPALPPSLHGVHLLGSQVSPSTDSVAYLVTWVKADQTTDAFLRVNTNVPVRIWVDGALVISEENIARGASDGLSAPVKLQKGWSEILVKSASEKRDWNFGARLTDQDGAPLLLESVRKRPLSTTPVAVDSAKKSAPAQVWGLHYASLATTPARGAFLAARLLRRAGMDRNVLAITETLVQQEPSSVSLFEHALALWDNEEAGKALDLLNAGVTRHGDDLGAFLVKRARFYRGKRLWDKAIADLVRTTGGERRAIVAEMELASIYGARRWRLQECSHTEAVAKRWPKSGWVMRNLARCYERRGYLERAIETYEEARRLEPGHLWGLRRLIHLYGNRSDHDMAWKLRQTVLDLDPQSTGPLVDAADERRKAGDLEGAEHLLRLAHQRDPDWERPLQRLGDLAFERGDKDAALAFWRKAIDKDPDDTRLADIVDHMAPQSLGLVENYIPDEAQIEQAIALGMSRRPVPGTNVVLTLDHEVTEVFNDGSARAVVTMVRRAVNKKGRDQLIQTTLPRRGKVKLLRAIARGPDGREQEASSVNGGVVRFRNITAGSTTVVQYVHNRPPQRFLPNHYVASWFFEGVATEYLQSTWVLITPQQRKLNVEIMGNGIAQMKTTEGTHVVRTFTSTDRAPFFGEPQMPPLGDLLARVNVSTVDGWDEYVRWERALLKNAFTSNPQLVSLSKKLVGDGSTTQEKFDRLFHYVAEEIRYQQDYENTIAGVRPHACPVVLERGYGDCKDKAVLLILLAQHAGIDVDFAILRTTPAGKVRKKIPNQQFNHAIVYLPKQDGIEAGRFYDPTTDGLDIGSLRADDQGAISLVLDPDSGDFAFHEIPYQTPDFETEAQSIVVEVAPDMSATAVAHGVIRGSQGSQLRRILRSDETARKVFEAIGGVLLSGATLQDFSSKNKDNIWEPVEFTMKLDATAAIQPMADAKRMWVPRMFPLKNAAKLQARRHPLRLGIHATSTLKTEFRFPAGATVTLLPSAFEVEHKCFTHKRTVKKEALKKGAGAIVIVEDITIRRCSEVAVEDYPAFRAAVLKAVGRLQDPLAFRMDKVAAGSKPSGTGPRQQLANR